MKKSQYEILIPLVKMGRRAINNDAEDEWKANILFAT